MNSRNALWSEFYHIVGIESSISKLDSKNFTHLVSVSKAENKFSNNCIESIEIWADKVRMYEIPRAKSSTSYNSSFHFRRIENYRMSWSCSSYESIFFEENEPARTNCFGEPLPTFPSTISASLTLSLLPTKFLEWNWMGFFWIGLAKSSHFIHWPRWGISLSLLENTQKV